MLLAVFLGSFRQPGRIPGRGHLPLAAPRRPRPMLDLKAVAADFDTFERRLARRGEKAAQALAPARPLFQRRRELNVLLEKQKKEQGEANARIRELARADKGAIEGARAALRALGDSVKKSETELSEVEAGIERMLLLV